MGCVDGGECKDLAGSQASLEPGVWSLMDGSHWSTRREQTPSGEPEAGEHLCVLTSPWCLLCLELLVPTLKEVGGTEWGTWSTHGEAD